LETKLNFTKELEIMKKIYFIGNKQYEILIISIAILIGLLVMIFTHHSIWYILPYIILEVLVLYFLLSLRYIIDNQYIKIQFGFITFQKIDINAIYKIVILDKQKGEPKNTPLRIEIYYNKAKKQLVYPKDTVKFVESIESVNPAIEII